ncbi:response regulator [Ascidiimonas aurantiaca]|uniref:response regulator n=1 Tax=Ascidiimonas aurantiaca TaxID=1685432 RepID=UPI0030ECC823
MFQKILIAEDVDNINEGIKAMFEKLSIDPPDFAQYCDDAYLKIRKAQLDNIPYDLLISDLSFTKDHRNQKLRSGVELIEAAKREQPNIKVIVYSVEDRIQTVKKLMKLYHINAYVCKGRNGLRDLQQALQKVVKNKVFFSSQVAGAVNRTNSLQIEPYDILLLDYLAKGYTQEQISEALKKNNKVPNSLSTVEKKINRLKVHFNAVNTTHLIAIVKDLGLI